MENREAEDTRFWQEARKEHRRGKIFGGMLLVIAGALFMARELGYGLPDWIFTWKTLLIALGLMSGARHGFRRLGWLIPVFIGASFLVADLYPEFSIKPYLLPVILILVGLFIIFKPSGRHRYHHCYRKRYSRHTGGLSQEPDLHQAVDPNDFIDSTSFMGGVKKNIITKNLKGADITNVFGGSEFNLMQADFPEKVTIEITQVFGGTKLVIPSNWVVKSSVVTILGGLEDKRPMITTAEKPRLLIIEGVNIFGGIEITSY